MFNINSIIRGGYTYQLLTPSLKIHRPRDIDRESY